MTDLLILKQTNKPFLKRDQLILHFMTTKLPSIPNNKTTKKQSLIILITKKSWFFICNSNHLPIPYKLLVNTNLSILLFFKVFHFHQNNLLDDSAVEEHDILL